MPSRRARRQRIGIALQFGKRRRMTVGVDVTDMGLLAVGALVSSILLSTAVLVRVAAARRPDLRIREASSAGAASSPAAPAGVP